MNPHLRNSYPYRLLSFANDYRAWRRRRYEAPSPHHIKQACIVRNGIAGSTWIETGTFLGQTTRVLAGIGSKVYSIEPEPTLFSNARKFFAGTPNVEILNGTSEDIFPALLPKIDGDVSFWLDGHYSAGVTFKGPKDTPVLDEIRCISENMKRFANVCVLIDDIRCFDPGLPEYSTYPPLDVLVDWAKGHRLRWHIEHDIFVAKN